jgi:hypothetical protein
LHWSIHPYDGMGDIAGCLELECREEAARRIAEAFLTSGTGIMAVELISRKGKVITLGRLTGWQPAADETAARALR